MGTSTFRSIFAVLVTISSCMNGAASYSYTGERSIRLSVLNSVTHDRMARPFDHTNATVGFTLLVINDLDIMTQQFEITGWFTVLWVDERLTWPPQNHDNTYYIHALEEEIWKPEVLIANAQGNIGLISDDHLIYRINYLGNVEWEPVVSSVTNCAIDVTYYPFDTQTCTMKLLSWGLPSTELSLVRLWDEVNMESFLGNGVWTVQETNVFNSLVTETINNATESYSQLEFRFILKRNPGNYVINTLIPVVISSFIMVIVNLVPIECGERVSAAFLTLVMDSILLMIFTSHIPDIETTTSLLGFYITFGFCLDVVWSATTVIETRIYHQPASKPVPRVLQIFVRVFKCLTLFFDPPPAAVAPAEPVKTISVPTDDILKVPKESKYEQNGLEQIYSVKKNSVQPDGFTEHVTSKGTTLPPINTGITKHKTLDGLDSIEDFENKRKRHETHKNHLNMNWMIVAAVFDRVLFVLFFAFKLFYNIMFILRIRGQ